MQTCAVELHILFLIQNLTPRCPRLASYTPSHLLPPVVLIHPLSSRPSHVSQQLDEYNLREQVLGVGPLKAIGIAWAYRPVHTLALTHAHRASTHAALDHVRPLGGYCISDGREPAPAGVRARGRATPPRTHERTRA